MTTPTPQPSFGQPTPGGWGHVPPVAPPAMKSSRRKAWFTHGAVALVALGLGAGMGGGAKGDGNATAPAPVATVTAAPKAAAPAPTTTAARPTTPTPKPAATTAVAAPKVSGDGEYLVGQDIKSGTYKTEGPGDSALCYWERDKDSSGEFDSIIANNNLSGSGRVTLKKGEVFKTQGCQDWTKVG